MYRKSFDLWCYTDDSFIQVNIKHMNYNSQTQSTTNILQDFTISVTQTSRKHSQNHGHNKTLI